jgi:hypothetical protein
MKRAIAAILIGLGATSAIAHTNPVETAQPTVETMVVTASRIVDMVVTAPRIIDSASAFAYRVETSQAVTAAPLPTLTLAADSNRISDRLGKHLANALALVY